MKNFFKIPFDEEYQKTTMTFLSISLVLIIISILIGINDNPPGIIVIYLGFVALIYSFIHYWRESRKFLILFVSSAIGFILFAVLHNLFDGIQQITGDIIILSQLLVFLSVTSFLLAVIVCPPGILIGIIGSIFYYFKGRNN